MKFYMGENDIEHSFPVISNFIPTNSSKSNQTAMINAVNFQLISGIFPEYFNDGGGVFRCNWKGYINAIVGNLR